MALRSACRSGQSAAGVIQAWSEAVDLRGGDLVPPRDGTPVKGQ